MDTNGLSEMDVESLYQEQFCYQLVYGDFGVHGIDGTRASVGLIAEGKSIPPLIEIAKKFEADSDKEIWWCIRGMKGREYTEEEIAFAKERKSKNHSASLNVAIERFNREAEACER